MAKRTTMQEGLKTLLAMNLGKGELIDPENVNDYLALEGQNVNVQNAILISQLNNALAGDSKAFKVLTDILGETTQKVEVDLKSENKSKLDSLIAQIDNHNTFDEEDLDAMKDYEDGTNLPQEE